MSKDQFEHLVELFDEKSNDETGPGRWRTNGDS